MIPKTHSRRRCKACHRPLPKARKPLPKVTRRKPIKELIDGVMVWANGKQKDMTRQARDRRRERLWNRDNRECQQRMVGTIPSLGRFGGVSICGKPLELHETHAHHIRKRSLDRDDRDENQVSLCYEHHELYTDQPQWSRRASA